MLETEEDQESRTGHKAGEPEAMKGAPVGGFQQKFYDGKKSKRWDSGQVPEKLLKCVCIGNVVNAIGVGDCNGGILKSDHRMGILHLTTSPPLLHTPGNRLPDKTWVFPRVAR
jgi:hypothetical protein